MLWWILLLIFCPFLVTARSLLRSAPQMCPIDDGNLLEVKLFVSNGNKCYNFCEENPDCEYFRFYEAMAGRPSQCFLFKSCGRKVENATFDCALNKENTIEVHPFVESEDVCQTICQNNRKCGYYKYIGQEEAGDDSRSEFCYLLSSCAKRMIDNINCPLGRNNFLEVKFFVRNLEQCADHCRQTEGCRYYWWYPIENSESPLYCYLFQQCATSDKEPEAALVIGGRHPGHYFLTEDEHNDLIMRNDVCMLGILDANISLARAGAVAQYVQGVVLFCGGQSLQRRVHRDCLMYNPMEDAWANFSRMQKGHDEASVVNAGNVTYVIGGVGERTVEYVDMKTFQLWSEQKDIEAAFIPKSRQKVVVTTAASKDDKTRKMPEWQLGPSLPDVRARSCAVANGPNEIFLLGGHSNDSLVPLATAYRLDNKGKWREMASMIEARKDHACLFIEVEDTNGILVTGGLGGDGQVLHSAEFYDVKAEKWTQVSSLKVGRTEHSMALIYGIPTVIGGISDAEFLSSIEQFDKSSASWNVPLQRDWRIINHVLNSPRYEMAVASIPISRIGACDADVI